MTKKSKGRQKLEMVKMQNEINLQVTFSKRRYGLFKKASELVSLCGAEVALIVFSPGGKVYTFGHPAVQTITQRYLGGAVGLAGGAAVDAAAAAVDGLKNFDDDAQRAILAVQLGNELNNKESLLENEKKIGEIMGEKIKNSPLYNRWGKASVDEMDPSELFQFKAALEGLKMDIDTMKLKKSMETLNETVTLPPIPNPFFAGNNNFGDPFFGYNNLNPNDDNFLTPFDPFFSPVPPNQNLGEESSWVGSTTFANNSYPPPLEPTIFANNSYLSGTTAFNDSSYPPLGTIAFTDTSYPPREPTTFANNSYPPPEATTFVDNSYLPPEPTTFVDNSYPPPGPTTFVDSSYPPPGLTTFAQNSYPPHGPTTFADNSYPPHGPTTFADNSYPPPGPTTFANNSYPPPGPTTFANNSYPPPGPTTFANNSYPPHGPTTFTDSSYPLPGPTTFAKNSYPPPGFLY